MSEKACKTPLTDLLRSVPADTRLVIERSSFAHDLIPVGRLCNEAAAELARLRAELAARDAAAVDAIAQAYEDGRISACNAGKPGCPRVAALEAECERLREAMKNGVIGLVSDGLNGKTWLYAGGPNLPADWAGSEVYIIRKEPKS